MGFVTTLKTERARVLVRGEMPGAETSWTRITTGYATISKAVIVWEEAGVLEMTGERDTAEDKVDSATSWTTTTTVFAIISKAAIVREEVEAQDTEEVKAELRIFECNKIAIKHIHQNFNIQKSYEKISNFLLAGVLSIFRLQAVTRQQKRTSTLN